MARARRNSQSTETTDNVRSNQMAFEALTDEALTEVLAASRSRGQYDAPLAEFIESGERGVRVPNDSGPYAGKKPGSIKTGFENARKREGAPEGAKSVRVIMQNEQVYLINDAVAA